MKYMHYKFAAAVVTEMVTVEGCLEQAGSAMRVLALPQIDQTTRNGP